MATRFFPWPIWKSHFPDRGPFLPGPILNQDVNCLLKDHDIEHKSIKHKAAYLWPSKCEPKLMWAENFPEVVQRYELDHDKHMEKVYKEQASDVSSLIIKPRFSTFRPMAVWLAQKWLKIRSSVLLHNATNQRRTFGYCKPCYFRRRCDLSLEKRVRSRAVRAILTKSAHIKFGSFFQFSQ